MGVHEDDWRRDVLLLPQDVGNVVGVAVYGKKLRIIIDLSQSSLVVNIAAYINDLYVSSISHNSSSLLSFQLFGPFTAFVFRMYERTWDGVILISWTPCHTILLLLIHVIQLAVPIQARYTYIKHPFCACCFIASSTQSVVCEICSEDFAVARLATDTRKYCESCFNSKTAEMMQTTPPKGITFKSFKGNREGAANFNFTYTKVSLAVPRTVRYNICCGSVSRVSDVMDEWTSSNNCPICLSSWVKCITSTQKSSEWGLIECKIVSVRRSGGESLWLLDSQGPRTG